jgi:hypothetical protein
MNVQSALKGQYHAALAMLKQTIEKCPDDLWTSQGQSPAFWRVAYHTLFYTHLYLQPDEKAFRAWDHAARNISSWALCPGRRTANRRSASPTQSPRSSNTGSFAIPWSMPPSIDSTSTPRSADSPGTNCRSWITRSTTSATSSTTPRCCPAGCAWRRDWILAGSVSVDGPACPLKGNRPSCRSPVITALGMYGWTVTVWAGCAG